MAPVVCIEQGRLKGSTSKDYKGNVIFQFQGIPYAKAPVGTLRFKAPQPPEPWEGVFDATKLGPACYSRNMIKFRQISGSEDCLNLNVYTKAFPSPKPVMVWIYGGGFILGSNSTDLYGPEFLLAEDIILVTINYRLGLLGFISFQDPAFGVPGNAGFKDMIMALKWVQKNISSFGGDPGNVTIFGESAGGVAVHLLVLSPMGKGLFHKAIAQSGVGLHPSFKATQGVSYLAAARHLETEQEVYNHLMTLTVEELLTLQEQAVSQKFVASQGRPIGYVVENGPDPFLAEDPFDIIYNGSFNQVPFILGNMANEGIIYEQFKDRVCNVLDNIEDAIPCSLGYELGSRESLQVAGKIQEFYGSRHQFWKLTVLGDITFNFWSCVVAKSQVKNAKNPIFLYKMILDTKLNFFKNILKDRVNMTGAYHLDDVGYLFKTDYTPLIQKGSLEEVSMGRVVKLWTNFAKFGDPTPAADSGIATKWEPVTREKLSYLEIGEQLVLLENPDADRIRFWEEIFENSVVKEKLFL